MPRKKDIYRNKLDFGHEEFATDMYEPEGRPRPREAASQKAQLNSEHQHGTNKGVKVPIDKKDTQ